MENKTGINNLNATNVLPKEQKKMLLANRLMEQLKYRQIKSAKLASMLGKKPSEISKWLSGTHNFTVETLFEIEAQLDVNLVNINAPLQESIKGSSRQYNITLPINSDIDIKPAESLIKSGRRNHKIFKCESEEIKIINLNSSRRN